MNQSFIVNVVCFETFISNMVLSVFNDDVLVVVAIPAINASGHNRYELLLARLCDGKELFYLRIRSLFLNFYRHFFLYTT